MQSRDLAGARTSAEQAVVVRHLLRGGQLAAEVVAEDGLHQDVAEARAEGEAEPRQHAGERLREGQARHEAEQRRAGQRQRDNAHHQRDEDGGGAERRVGREVPQPLLVLLQRVYREQVPPAQVAAHDQQHGCPAHESLELLARIDRLLRRRLVIRRAQQRRAPPPVRVLAHRGRALGLHC